MRIASPAHAVFALTLIALGVSGLLQGDFAAIWQPVPKSLPGREALAVSCAVIALATGLGLFWERSAVLAARVLLGWLLLWLLLCKGRVVWLAPAQMASWESVGETAVLISAAGVLCTGDRAIRLARVVYGLALVAFGLAHLAYVQETAALVPSWLPSPTAWVYFTGGTYIAAGVAVVADRLARLAATLSAVQIGLFTLLVWLPAIATGTGDAGQWSEAVLSWALTTAAWVVADAYRGQAWLALAKPR